MSAWRYKRDRTVTALQHLPDGDEFIVFCAGKVMMAARQEIVLRSAGKLVDVFLKAMIPIAEEKKHYQPVVDSLTKIAKEIEECLNVIDAADKTNKLLEDQGASA
jgi:hypothetical protein